MLNPAAAARRAIPSVDRLLKLEAVDSLVDRYGRPLVVETLRAVLDEQRAAFTQAPAQIDLDATALIATCAQRLRTTTQASLKPVFNLTGTVLHTNLGRALLPRAAAEAALMAMTHAVNLEFDLGGGERGERDSHVEAWLKRLTGAEAAVLGGQMTPRDALAGIDQKLGR